jgi:hypothetical protein
MCIVPEPDTIDPADYCDRDKLAAPTKPEDEEKISGHAYRIFPFSIH